VELTTLWGLDGISHVSNLYI